MDIQDTLILSTRVPKNTRDRLREHAADVGRSLNMECRLWLKAGAAMSAYAAFIDPRAPLTFPDPEELEALRADALAVMRDAMAHALPHHVAPEVVISAFTASPSMN